MTYEIKATIEQVRAAAGQIDQDAQQIRSLVQQIEGTVGGLQATFLGERASAFFSSFNTAKGQMDAWYSIVESFSAELTEAANRYHAADSAGN